MDRYVLQNMLRDRFLKIGDDLRYGYFRDSDDVISDQEAEKVSEMVKTALQEVCKAFTLTIAQEYIEKHLGEERWGDNKLPMSLESLREAIKEMLKPNENGEVDECVTNEMANDFFNYYEQAFGRFDQYISGAIRQLVEDLDCRNRDMLNQLKYKIDGSRRPKQ